MVQGSIADLQTGDIAVHGIGFDEHGSFMKGPAKAPDKIYEAFNSPSANYFTEDLKDLQEHESIRWLGTRVFRYDEIEPRLRQILDQGAIPFSLGGDHSITFPILQAYGAVGMAPSILQFDAHSDLYDELDGNRFSHACPFARIMENGLAKSLTQIGIRTLTAHQRQQADRFRANVIEMKDWHQEKLLQIPGPVYVSFDMDVFDPAFAPGISHHEPGGFSVREILHILQNMDVQIVGADIVEYNPDRDVNGVTAMVAAKVMKELLARMV